MVKRSEIVTEITTVLEDWGELFKKFYLSTHANFQPISRKIRELIRLRSQILSGNLPVDEMKEVKLQATAEIDTGNSLLGELILLIVSFRFSFVCFRKMCVVNLVSINWIVCSEQVWIW